MKLYPWIKKSYQKIILQYQKNCLPHAILIHAIPGLGINMLITQIMSWIMCINKSVNKNCTVCNQCKLIQAGLHPDIYNINLQKKNGFIGIEDIQNLIQKINLYPHQDNCKIIWFSDINILTESAINALLKTLESPPRNSYFFLQTFRPLNLLSTLKSRCMNFYIQVPQEKESIVWLEKKTRKSNLICTTALRLNAGAPLSSLNFIKKYWEQRITFLKIFFKSMESDIFHCISILDNDLVIIKINWILYILIDSIKYQQKNENIIVNLDQIFLIQKIASYFSFYDLERSIYLWKSGLYVLHEEKKINRKFILTEKIINWESIIKNMEQ